MWRGCATQGQSCVLEELVDLFMTAWGGDVHDRKPTGEPVDLCQGLDGPEIPFLS